MEKRQNTDKLFTGDRGVLLKSHISVLQQWACDVSEPIIRYIHGFRSPGISEVKNTFLFHF